MQLNTQPEAEAVAQALTDPATEEVDDNLDHEIDGVPPMGANNPNPDKLDEIVEHPDMDTHVPTEDEEKKIALVIDAGTEYKTLHVKLMKLFDKCRPWVQDLKDNLFRVRQGSSGRAVVIGGIALSWDEFCHATFDVGAKRINQLLEIDDRKDDLRPTLPPVKKLHLTQQQLEEMLDAKYEEGIAAAAEGVEDEVDETEAGVPEVVRQLEEAVANAEVPKLVKGDDVYDYFRQFEKDKQTIATELSAMLVELGLDLQDINEVLRLAAKDAKKTLIDMCVGSEKK